ncbi:MAG: hypothetical protein IPM63_08170 [Acidobacteriota bacterium]|nr:MAG: hypothetical protein IPM63_08170 [Acidobacteriota bacterium]
MSAENGSLFLRTVTDRRTSLAIFGLFAALVASVAIVASAWIPEVAQPDLLAAAIAIDLLITVPVAFYFLVSRRYSLSLPAFAPVIGAGWLIAYLVLPDGHRAPLLIAEAGVLAFEVAIVAWIARKVWKAAKSPSDELEDPLSRLRRIAGETVGNRRLGSVAGTELGVLFYSLFSWRSRPSVPEGGAAFTYHRKSGQTAITIVLLFLIAAETAVAHYLISLWSAPVAWAVTALSVYGGLWILADLRASVLRPVLIADDSILIKAGLRYDVEIPIEMMDCIERAKPSEGPLVSAALFGDPTHWIVLNETLQAEGVFGFRSEFRAIGFSPDEPAAFEVAVGEALRSRDD